MVDLKDQVITLGALTDCEKGFTPLPVHSFHKQCEKARWDLGSISAESREAVCFHMQSVYHIALRDRQSGAPQTLLCILSKGSHLYIDH